MRRLRSQGQGLAADEPTRLVRRAKLLAWGGNAWHFGEFAIAVGACIAAESITLIGFGFDSLIETLAGFIIIWRFAARRAQLETTERRAQRSSLSVTSCSLPTSPSRRRVRSPSQTSRRPVGSGSTSPPSRHDAWFVADD
jgi:hypothetical protein